MAQGRSRRTREASEARKFIVGMARAFGGALIFALPMLMTMEMWYLGFHMDRWRLALLLLLLLPLLVGLGHYIGFEATFGWRDDLRDALIAIAVGAATSALILLGFAVLAAAMSPSELLGKIAIQTVPASIGAMLARSELGARDEELGPRGEGGYGGALMLMAAGALFLGLNVAPTEEMVLIAYQMTRWHAVFLALLSLILMHGFVYAVEFRGQAALPPDTPFWSAFLRFTVVGYGLSLLISLYVLWTFGRTDGEAPAHIAMAMVVLGFPAAVGAAAARLIL